MAAEWCSGNKSPILNPGMLSAYRKLQEIRGITCDYSPICVEFIAYQGRRWMLSLAQARPCGGDGSQSDTARF